MSARSQDPSARERSEDRSVRDQAHPPAPAPLRDTVRACLALGSNLGNRRATIEGAVDELGRTDGITIVAVSTLIETDPVGITPDVVPGEPVDGGSVFGASGSVPGPFLNGAVVIDTTLEPLLLLETLLAIEARFGRQRAAREGAGRSASRTLDLDILFYGDRVIRSENLTVPHPRMHERRFVLVPLAEVAPDAVHPLLGCRVQSLLASLDPPPSGTSGSAGIPDGRPCSSPLNRSTNRSTKRSP